MSLSSAQLKLRRTGLTATDMVVLSSGSDWHGRTLHDVWRSKVLGRDDFEESEAMSLGNELEPMVLRRTAEKAGIKIRKGETIRHPEQPRFLATPDAFGVGTDGDVLVQGKVVGLHNARGWGESGSTSEAIPEVVFVQCAWELFVGMRRVNIVGALIGTEVRVYKIRREEDGIDELVGSLIEIGQKFWTDYVLSKKPPPVDGSEGAARMLAAIWPRAKRPAIVAGPEAEEYAQTYFQALRTLKSADAAKKLSKQKLEELVGDHEGMTGDGWRLLLTRREETQVPAYTRKAYRHFDLRSLKGRTNDESDD